MKTHFERLPTFMGIMRNLDITEMPFGMAFTAQNVAQYVYGRLQRIAGLTPQSTVAVDGSNQIVLAAFIREAAGTGTANVVAAVYMSATNVPVIVNATTPAAMTGPALTGSQFANWNYAFYAQQHIIASDTNGLMQITGTGTYVALTPTGSPPAKGGLIRSFLDRLYWAGDQTNASNEGIVYYTDALTNNFSATGFVNVKEIPGPVTALGVYEPSTGGTAGAVGIKGGLLIFKRNAIWYWDESSKDLISAKIGTLSPHTIQNSPVGVIFLGKRSDQNSVFVIPPGYYGYIHFGEPIDVGKPLFNLLNGFNVGTWKNNTGATVTWQNNALQTATWATNAGVNNPITASAVVDGKFYKLFLSVGNDTQNQTEVWLDLDSLTENPGETRGGRPPTAVWYGPHTRGGFDAVTTAEALGTYMFARGASAAQTIFTENQDLTKNFLDWKGNTMLAFIDLPMNFEPLDVEKIYDIAELHIAPEANLPGFAITYNFLADNEPQGQGTATYEVDTSNPGIEITHALIPLYGAGRSGTTAHHGRLQLTFSLNQRFDLVGFVAQYISPDLTRIFPHIRT